MKRFYSAVSIDGAGQILLDGRPVHTPGKARLILPTQALAAAIASEWQAQQEAINPRSMPMTGLANAAIDHMAADPSPHVEALARYGASDLLCYRADEAQADLAAEQVRRWNPLLDWAEQRYAVEFVITNGIAPVDQLPATRTALRDAVAMSSAWQLAPLVTLTTLGGSLVAALALRDGAFTADHLWDCVTLDEIWQERQWGVDADAAAQRAARAAEWHDAARFISLIDE